MNCVYKIRRKSDGLYSKGKTSPSFNKVGKTWSSWRNLVLHLSLVRDGLTHVKPKDRLREVYNGCEIVEFKETSSVRIDSFFATFFEEKKSRFEGD